MAESTSVKVVMKFINEEERDLSVTMNYAKSDVTDAAVKNLMDTMIQKAEIFNNPPYQKVGADKVVTTTTEMSVTD